VKQIFKAIYAACASLERPARVAVVGVEGSLGYVAARQVFGGGAQPSFCDSPSAALEEVTRGRAEFALVPFESSHEGTVVSSILALMQTDLVVSAICELAAGVALLNHTGNPEDIEKIYATAHDRVHCESFLHKRIPRATIIDVRSPAIGCRFAVEDHGGATIAHEQMGDIHGLTIAIANIGEQHDLRMRYAVVGTRLSSRTGKDTTSIVFTLNDQPGALAAVLNDFATRGINVKSIMSRPVPGEKWDYVFYLDVHGHASDRGLVIALDEIRKYTKLMKIIGSFSTHC
jgi:chorismate mutase/prephenate dehydratase